MSLVVIMRVPNGIVMASDSRTSFSLANSETVRVSDYTTKLFLTPSGVGIARTGAGDINGIPMESIMLSFIRQSLTKDDDVIQVTDKLFNYLEKMEGLRKSKFLIAGYTRAGQQLQAINILNDGQIKKEKFKDELDIPGVTWSGDGGDILARLIDNMYYKTGKDRDQYKAMPDFGDLPYNMFAIQDAIDFVRFAIRTTIDMMRFQLRPKTVGGAIDVIVLTPEGGFWVNKKELMVKG